MTTNGTPNPNPETVRAYFRCGDCLSVYAIAVEKPPHLGPRASMFTHSRAASDVAWLGRFAPICGPCDVSTDPMGIVAGSGLVLTTERQVCDPACQSAQGPTCDCQCGGANHGARWVAETIILGMRETVPVVTRDDEKATARATEYRAARDAATAALAEKWAPAAEIIEKKRRGSWLTAGEFETYLAWSRDGKALRAAIEGKTHKGRMTKLAKLAAGFVPAVEG